jgi:WD40-like Beta Propeller Repeat
MRLKRSVMSPSWDIPGMRRVIALAVAGLLAGAAPAAADALLYRCGSDICRAAPNGTAKRAVTTDGRAGGPLYSWLSASADGTRVAVVRATFAYVLDPKDGRAGAPLPRGGTAVIAEMSPDGSQVATIELLPEITPAPVGSPPGSPGLSGLMPYLFTVSPDGTGREAAARAIVDTGWLGPRLVRTDPSRASPFALGLCVLAVNTDFACERDVARDPARDLFNPAFSPDGTRVAVVQAPGAEIGKGAIAIYDAATAAPVRELAGGENTQPSWSPDGRRLAFERGGDVYTIGADGGTPRRVLRGAVQPVWVSAPACGSRPRLRHRRRVVVVTACAPQPGRLTVVLRRDGRVVARKSVRAAVGGLVTLRFPRPAGRVRATAELRRRAGQA